MNTKIKHISLAFILILSVSLFVFYQVKSVDKNIHDYSPELEVDQFIELVDHADVISWKPSNSEEDEKYKKHIAAFKDNPGEMGVYENGTSNMLVGKKYISTFQYKLKRISLDYYSLNDYSGNQFEVKVFFKEGNQLSSKKIDMKQVLATYNREKKKDYLIQANVGTDFLVSGQQEYRILYLLEKGLKNTKMVFLNLDKEMIEDDIKLEEAFRRKRSGDPFMLKTSPFYVENLDYTRNENQYRFVLYYVSARDKIDYKLGENYRIPLEQVNPAAYQILKDKKGYLYIFDKYGDHPDDFKTIKELFSPIDKEETDGQKKN